MLRLTCQFNHLPWERRRPRRRQRSADSLVCAHPAFQPEFEDKAIRAPFLNRLTLLFFALFVLAPSALAATFTASLERDTITLGESVKIGRASCRERV